MCILVRLYIQEDSWSLACLCWGVSWGTGERQAGGNLGNG